MLNFLRLASGLALVLGMLGAGPVRAQSAINKAWGRTDLDTVVSVRTPYRAQDTQEPGAPWLTAFFTKGSYHHFVMMRLDARRCCNSGWKLIRNRPAPRGPIPER